MSPPTGAAAAMSSPQQATPTVGSRHQLTSSLRGTDYPTPTQALPTRRVIKAETRGLRDSYICTDQIRIYDLASLPPKASYITSHTVLVRAYLSNRSFCIHYLTILLFSCHPL
ncbi:hypothetical protein EVAR_103859_1 [Eumeta japonica]|uniref:Uncharacterized protein n=1 Tax=Eumeta variegata TaxID=151549 RepID=A0A4C2A9I7_EUMVA|nr:hypothetical protein EVAR_103859_1 [Eumeta japonica]